MLKSQRQTSTPTRAVRTATSAVASPPDHSLRASTLTPTLVRPSGILGDVIAYLPTQFGSKVGAPAARRPLLYPVGNRAPAVTPQQTIELCDQLKEPHPTASLNLGLTP